MKIRATTKTGTGAGGVISSGLACRIREAVEEIGRDSGAEWSLDEFVLTDSESGWREQIFELRVRADQPSQDRLAQIINRYVETLMESVSAKERRQLLDTAVWVRDFNAIRVV